MTRTQDPDRPGFLFPCRPHRATTRRRTAPVVLLLLSLLFSNGAVASRVKTGIERFVGRQVASVLRDQYGFCESPILNRWVNRVGQTIAASAPRHDVRWRFAVLDTDEVNAVAAPGGFVFVTKGLLHTARSEDEIAAVIGHEAGHVVESHGWDQSLLEAALLWMYRSLDDDRRREAMTALAAADGLFLLHVSRRDELQADQWGVRLAAEAGYDPAGMLSFCDTLRWLQGKPPNHWQVLLATHPPEATRRRAVENSPWLTPPEPEETLRRAEALVRRHRYRHALRLYRRVLTTHPRHPRALAATRQLTRLLADIPSPKPLPAPEPLREKWTASQRLAPQKRQELVSRRRALVQRIRAAFRQRRRNSPLQQLVVARINPEDLAWLHVAWRVLFLQAKIDDALMRSGQVSREALSLFDEFEQARRSLLERGVVPSLAPGAERALSEKRRDQIHRQLAAALVDADSAAQGARRALGDMVPPLLVLLDPTRSRLQRIKQGRLVAGETTLIHAELATQRAWRHAVTAETHLAAAAVSVKLTQLAAMESSGELASARCLDLACFELGCPPAQLTPVPLPGGTVADRIERAFLRLEHVPPRRQPREGSWTNPPSPVDLTTAWIALQFVQRAWREEAATQR